MSAPDSTPRRRPSVATREGEWKTPRIDGLVFRRLPPLEDERGEVTEIFRADWGFDDAPVTQIYRVTLRPGVVKAWNLHEHQADRIAVMEGALRWAFYDARSGSETAGNLVVRTFSERHRHLFVIPPGIWHGCENVGAVDAAFINLPTRAYDHDRPDKLALPVENGVVPFAFGRTPE